MFLSEATKQRKRTGAGGILHQNLDFRFATPELDFCDDLGSHIAQEIRSRSQFFRCTGNKPNFFAALISSFVASKFSVRQIPESVRVSFRCGANLFVAFCR
jgi:hypothetical protein